jgi:glycosyltransferase involved in cell wall biosynthesis
MHSAGPGRLTILTGIFPPDIGGPATSVPELVRSLAADGWSVTVVTLADDTQSVEDDPCPVIRVPRARRWPLRALAVVRAVRASRAEVVLANGLHLESALLPGVPVVQKIVGDWAWERARNAGATTTSITEFQRGPLPPKPRALRALRGWVARRARRVVVPSRYLGGVVAGWGVDEERIRVVFNAAPEVGEAPPDGGSATSRRQQALFVGRLVSWKHVDHMIRVLPRFGQLELAVVGTGEEQAALEVLARDLGVESRVRFLGRRDRAAVFELMRESALLVLPSSYEGMPHVVLEAFACGLPVVASDAGGTPELVRDRETGFLYPWGDLNALERAIQAALNAQEASAPVRGGAELAQSLTSAATASGTARVLVEALEARRAGGR